MKGEQVRDKLAREILRKLRLVRALCGSMLVQGTPTAGCPSFRAEHSVSRRPQRQRRRMIGISYAMKFLPTSQRCWTSRRGVRPHPKALCCVFGAGSFLQEPGLVTAASALPP